MRILVTGAKGRLGRQVVANLSGKHQIIPADRSLFDITDFYATCKIIGELKPNLVIHTAAWTDVDGCAERPDKAIVINGFGTQNIALAAAFVNASILYISSNEVFDGMNKSPYREYEYTNPLNPYGYSKVVGERALVNLNPKHYIVRTSWLFGHSKSNFLYKILNSAKSQEPLRLVTNEIANPTYINDLSDALIALIETERYGIYHFTNSGVCSRYELGEYFLRKLNYKQNLTPIQSHEWLRKSTPPEFTNLANTEGDYIGIHLRPWQSAVDAYIKTSVLKEQF